MSPPTKIAALPGVNQVEAMALREATVAARMAFSLPAGSRRQGYLANNRLVSAAS